MNKFIFTIVALALFLVPNVAGADPNNARFFEAFDVNTEARVFLFIFMTLGVAYVGLKFMPEFASIVFIIATFALFNTNVHFLYPIIYFIIAVMFIGRSLEPPESRIKPF